MSTKKQLEKLTKAELVKKIQEMEKAREEAMETRRKESQGHLTDIMNLQARVVTMRHQQLREHEELVAARKLIDGLKMQDMIGQHARMFDIRTSRVMNRISELLRKNIAQPPVPIHVCPMCGKITPVKEGRSGERICEKCRMEVDWPWMGEIVWRLNEEGNFEGRTRGGYTHPDGGAITVDEVHLAE